MKEQTLQDIAVQKSLALSEQDALKVLIFMVGLDAGAKLLPTEKAVRESECDRAS